MYNRLNHVDVYMKFLDEDAEVGEVAYKEHTFFEPLGLGLNVGGFLSQIT